MQSIKNSEEGQEATPTEERASGTEIEFSEMKRRLGELEKLLSLKQSMETQRKLDVVPEAPQSGGQTFQWSKEALFRNLSFDQKNFLGFKSTLILRLRKAGVSSNDDKLNLLLSCLSMEQQELWSRMPENSRESFEDVLSYFESLYGRRNELSLRDFVNIKQGRESGADFALRVQKESTRVRLIRMDQVISSILTGLRPNLSALLPQIEYQNISTLIQDIEKCDQLLGEREKLWGFKSNDSFYNRTVKTSIRATDSLETLLEKKFGIDSAIVRQRLKERKCIKCGKFGHVAKVCRSKEARVHEVHDCSSNEKERNMQHDIESIESEISSKREILFRACINGKQGIAKLDTGAMVSVVDRSFVQPADIRQVKTYVRGVGGIPVKVLGETTISLRISRKTLHRVKALVIAKLEGKNLLLSLHDYLRFGGTFGGNIWKELNLSVENVEVCTDMKDEEKWIKNSIRQFYQIDPTKQSTLGPFTIELRDNKSSHDICSKPFRLSKEKQHILDEKLGLLVANGVLEEKDGESSSPVFLLKKPNGDYRLLCDFRKFNNCTKSVASTLENMEDLIGLAEGKKFFTTVDLSDGFFQVAITDEAQGLTGIVTQNSRYQFKVLPQGAKQSPQLFHKAVRKLLKGMPNAVNYVDDILVCSENMQEAKEDFISLLKVLSNHNLQVKWEKAKIMCRQVDFLGYRISGEGKKAGKAANGLLSIPSPKSKGDVKKLLGRIGYFRNFVQNYAIKIAPIQHLLKAGTPFSWSHEMTAIVREVAKEIIETKLAFPSDGELTIECDAAKLAIGAVLKSNGKLVKCYSEILGDSQTRWSSFEKELYAVRQALKSFERLIGGKKVLVRTDNEAVAKFLQGGGELGAKPIRIREWVSDLLSRDFTVSWVRGKSNVHADALSRLGETGTSERNNSFSKQSNRMQETAVEVVTRSKDKIVKSKKHSTETSKKAIVQIGNNAVDSKPSDINHGMEVLSRDRIQEVLRKAHLAHGGIGAMLLNLKELTWKGKIEDVRQFVRNCFYCKCKKAPKRNSLKGMQCNQIGEIVCIDSFKFDDQWFVIAVEYLSGFTNVVECESANAESSANCLLGLMSIVGKPDRVLSDNGSEFKGEFSELLNEMDIKHIKTAVNHPQSNMAERRIQEVKKILAIQKLEEDRTNIFKASMLINHQRSRISGYSPCEMITGTRGLGILHDSTRFKMSQEERKQNVEDVMTVRAKRREKENVKLDNRNFAPNDLVWLFENRSLHLGIIKEKLHYNCYIVEFRDKKRKVSGDVLLKSGDDQNDFMGEFMEKRGV